MYTGVYASLISDKCTPKHNCNNCTYQLYNYINYDINAILLYSVDT